MSLPLLLGKKTRRTLVVDTTVGTVHVTVTLEKIVGTMDLPPITSLDVEDVHIKPLPEGKKFFMVGETLERSPLRTLSLRQMRIHT